MLTIHPIEIGSTVLSKLNKGNVGSVHSVFRSGFNLVFNERLIHIGSYKEGIAPFSIGLSQREAILLTRKMKLNKAVYWNNESKTLTLDSNIVLTLQHIKPIQLVFNKRTFSTKDIVKRFNVIVEEYIDTKQFPGFFESKEESIFFLKKLNIKSEKIMNHSFYETIQLDQTFMNHILILHNNIKRVEESDLTKCFDYFIGRGVGLTPSGDDLLTGICAMLHILFHGNHPLLTCFKQYINDIGKKRTTAVAYEYLYYIVNKNLFHSIVFNVLESFTKDCEKAWRQSLKDLQTIGHTSGIDILLGMLIVLNIYTKY